MMTCILLAPHDSLAAKPARPTPTTGTMVLSGTMTSTATLTMHGAFSVGAMTDFTWSLPLITSIDVGGYSERIRPPQFTFSVPPDSSQDATDPQGYPVRQFYWASPPTNTVIDVTETVHAVVRSNLSPFTSVASYPLSGSLPPSVQPYLRVTPLTQLSVGARGTLPGFKAGSEETVVRNVADYVASRLRFNSDATGNDASTVFASQQANPAGFANLMAGLLRGLGIPARIEYGWTGPKPATLPGPGKKGVSRIQWSGAAGQGALDTWLDVYFPDAGWVAFDPQAEKFFVDTRHFAFFTSVDAGAVQIGTWSGDAAGESATRSTLTAGNYQIVPGGGVGSVDIVSQDAFHVRFVRVRHDVRGIVLFGRE